MIEGGEYKDHDQIEAGKDEEAKDEKKTENEKE